jgi:hypothetical protein
MCVYDIFVSFCIGFIMCVCVCKFVYLYQCALMMVQYVYLYTYVHMRICTFMCVSSTPQCNAIAMAMAR